MVWEVGEFFEDCGIEYDVNELLGDFVEVIIEFVDEEDVDFIVIVGWKCLFVGKVLFGSVM